MLPDLLNQSLPQGNGFLRSYVTYASQCSDAPELYHAGVAVTIFAAAVAKKLACPFLSGRVLSPNLYTLLVGPSRSSRKTSSMDTGIDILRTAMPDLVIPIPGSYEEMVAQIRTTPSGVLTYREFGHFLKTTQRGYGEPIRTVLMDLYDWPIDRAYTRNLKKLKTVIEPPICVSMLSSCSTDSLFRFCVDEETEMLTASGWKRHGDVSVGELCYTLNHDTGLGEWQPVSAINVFEGDPSCEMLLMEGRGHSSLSTLNHRWPVRNKGNSTWGRRWRTSETLNQSDYIQCAAHDAGLPTTPAWSDAFVEIVAWLWTEGSWNVSNALSLSQSSRVNPKLCDRIRSALFAYLGPRCEGSMFPHRHSGTPLWVEDKPDADGLVFWRLNQAASHAFTKVLSIPEKVVSHTWLRTLTLPQLELFIETSFLADGDLAKKRLAQTSKGRAEAFGFACILAGKPVSYVAIDNDHNKQYEIGVLRRRQFSPIQNAENNDNRPFKAERVRHGGAVWCPTTPNGTWLARRKGSVYWTGNTDSEEWTGGFFGRMLLLYGERDTWREPSTWPAARDALVTLLHQHANFPFPVCGGFSPQAWDLFRTWSRWLDSKTHDAPARLQTHISGAPTLAAKIALLFAADAAEVVAGNGWLISLESMNRAIRFVQNLYIPSIMDIGNRLALGIWEQDRQRVLDAVKDHGQIGITEQNLLRRVRLEATFLEQICNTLRLEGSIAKSDTGKGVVYRLSHPDGKGNVVILGADGQPANANGTIEVPGLHTSKVSKGEDD